MNSIVLNEKKKKRKKKKRHQILIKFQRHKRSELFSTILGGCLKALKYSKMNLKHFWLGNSYEPKKQYSLK